VHRSRGDLQALEIFAAEEGGAEHCQVDKCPMGMEYIADWLIDSFGLPTLMQSSQTASVFPAPTPARLGGRDG